MAGGGDNKDYGTSSVTSPSRRKLIEALSILIPSEGAGKYWYVDPRARPNRQQFDDAVLRRVIDKIGTVPEDEGVSF